MLPAGREQWYAVAVKPRHDKAVCRTLENKGYEAIAPLYMKRYRQASRWRESELPLFPGYVFCRFNAQARLPILMTPGVIQVLGAGRVPTPVDEAEMASLQTALELQLHLRPYPFLETGQHVRIKEGPLAGIEGVVVDLKPNLRIVLSITLLQRSILLETDSSSVSAEGKAA